MPFGGTFDGTLKVPSGRYRHAAHRSGDKRKMMALGVYPEVALATAREDRVKARKLLTAGNDPMADRKVDKLIRVTDSGNSFQSVALEWHKGQSVRWRPSRPLERQLDHSERSKVVAAYARSENLEKRRRMMEDWGCLVDALEAGDNGVPLARAA